MNPVEFVRPPGAGPRTRCFRSLALRVSSIARLLLGLETKQAYGVALATLTPFSASSHCRLSGHSKSAG